MRSIPILLLALILVSCGQKEVSYREQIQPILTARCVTCHGPDIAYDKIRLGSFEELMNSRTRSGKQPLVTAGNLQESRLYVLASTSQSEFRMPPDTAHKPPLPKEELALLSRWILQGAKDN